MASRKILVVEDEEFLRIGLREYLRHQGHEVVECETCADATPTFDKFRPDIAIIDYLLPDGTALDLLPRFREIDSSVPLVVLTGHATIDLAVRAIKEGAEQFLTKPIEFPALQVVIERTLEHQRNLRRLAATSTEQARHTVDPFVGRSRAIRDMAEQARRVVLAERPVLILGETGTGKSVLARWLHQNGPRADEAFVDFNCAGLSKDLLDTELFGHEKGAFTGAVAAKTGLLEVAHRGTVFLDEIGDMDLQVQPKLLKVLEEQRFRRVGAIRDRNVDVRLIAATHQNLDEAVRERRFRSDLYFRISTLPLMIPPLRDRGEDVIDLARALLKNMRGSTTRRPITIAASAEQAMLGYSWPGNIRELRNVLERATLLCEGSELTADNLLFRDVQQWSESSASGASVEPLRWTLQENERRHILRVLESLQGNVVEAASVLGISRSALYVKLKKHGITPNR